MHTAGLLATACTAGTPHTPRHNPPIAGSAACLPRSALLGGSICRTDTNLLSFQPFRHLTSAGLNAACAMIISAQRTHSRAAYPPPPSPRVLQCPFPSPPLPPGPPPTPTSRPAKPRPVLLSAHSHELWWPCSSTCVSVKRSPLRQEAVMTRPKPSMSNLVSPHTSSVRPATMTHTTPISSRLGLGAEAGKEVTIADDRRGGGREGTGV